MVVLSQWKQLTALWLFFTNIIIIIIIIVSILSCSLALNGVRAPVVSVLSCAWLAWQGGGGGGVGWSPMCSITSRKFLLKMCIGVCPPPFSSPPLRPFLLSVIQSRPYLYESLFGCTGGSSCSEVGGYGQPGCLSRVFSKPHAGSSHLLLHLLHIYYFWIKDFTAEYKDCLLVCFLLNDVCSMEPFLLLKLNPNDSHL